MSLPRTWWDDHHDDATLLAWLGTPYERPRRYMRRLMRFADAASVLDVGAGPCLEHDGWQSEPHRVAYTMVDATVSFVAAARQRGISAHHGSINALPFPNASFDVVYARHVLEHIPEGFRPGLAEMARVARRLVMHDFFIPPSTAPTLIDGPVGGLYHNRYNRAEINAHIYSLGWRVRWKKIDADAILVMVPR